MLLTSPGPESPKKQTGYLGQSLGQRRTGARKWAVFAKRGSQRIQNRDKFQISLSSPAFQ